MSHVELSFRGNPWESPIKDLLEEYSFQRNRSDSSKHIYSELMYPDMMDVFLSEVQEAGQCLVGHAALFEEERVEMFFCWKDLCLDYSVDPHTHHLLGLEYRSIAFLRREVSHWVYHTDIESLTIDNLFERVFFQDSYDHSLNKGIELVRGWPDKVDKETFYEIDTYLRKVKDRSDRTLLYQYTHDTLIQKEEWEYTPVLANTLYLANK
ncbi:MAG: hypothetical protein OEY01_03600 [Desulfobulbaceae bacterium]|nr:hypothetical protein [Desulfobulbaceae bacterium]